MVTPMNADETMDGRHDRPRSERATFLHRRQSAYPSAFIGVHRLWAEELAAARIASSVVLGVIACGSRRISITAGVPGGGQRPPAGGARGVLPRTPPPPPRERRQGPQTGVLRPPPTRRPGECFSS